MLTNEDMPLFSNIRMRLTLRQICRLGCALMLPAIFALSLWGRLLERAFPFLITVIGPTALLVLGVFLGAAIRQSGIASAKALRSTRGAILLAATLFAVAAGIAACERQISMPIERLHFAKYALLAFLAFSGRERDTLVGALLNSAALAYAVGWIDETIQLFVPNRVFDLNDMFLNWSGATFGLIVALLVLAWTTPRLTAEPPKGPANL